MGFSCILHLDVGDDDELLLLQVHVLSLHPGELLVEVKQVPVLHRSCVLPSWIVRHEQLPLLDGLDVLHGDGSLLLGVEGSAVASIIWNSYFWQDHLRAAAAQSHLGNIHLLSSHSRQHLTYGGGLGLLLHQGVLGLGQLVGPSDG